MDDLITKIFSKLKQHDFMLATAESCTGGMISAAITDVSGSSAFFDRGFVTYSNEAKMQMLGVRPQIIDSYGAVSEETAQEMAVGAVKNSNAQISIAVTGVAGPGGGTDEKPVGLVYIAVARQNDVQVAKNLFSGTRSEIRQQTCHKAVQLVLDSLV